MRHGNTLMWCWKKSTVHTLISMRFLILFYSTPPLFPGTHKPPQKELFVSFPKVNNATAVSKSADLVVKSIEATPRWTALLCNSVFMLGHLSQNCRVQGVL